MESKERTALGDFYMGITIYRFCNCQLASIIKGMIWSNLRDFREAVSRDSFSGLSEKCLTEMCSHGSQGRRETFSEGDSAF